MLNNTAPRSLTDICEEYGIEGEKKASSMIVTVKRRLGLEMLSFLEPFRTFGQREGRVD